LPYSKAFFNTNQYAKKILCITAIAASSVGYAQKIAGGIGHSLHICPNGSAQTWGKNILGLGNGTNTNNVLPKTITALSGTVISVVAGFGHSLFLKNDGTVWAYGNNEFGQLGVGDTINRLTPVQVAITGSVIAIAGKGLHSLFLKSDSTVWACGENTDGQLGLGDYINRRIPQQVPITGSISAIDAGYRHSLFLKSNGYAWSCGYNARGELGSILVPATTNAKSNTPVQVFSFPKIIAISAGDGHSLFLKDDGTAWACGYNHFGQLGRGNNADLSVPLRIDSLTGVVTKIDAGHLSSGFIKSDGTVWVCGYNGYGQLGTLNNENYNVPVKAAITGSVTELSIAHDLFNPHSLFLKSDGTLLACGSNINGQLGNGSSGQHVNSTPTQVQSLCQPPPTVPPTVAPPQIPNNSVCKGSPVNASAVTIGSNPDRQVIVDNSINLNNPIAIDKNSTGVFVLNNNNSITKYNFNGAVVNTYPSLSLTNIWAFTVDESDNVYINNGSTDGNGYPVFIKCNPTGATVTAIPNGFMGVPNYVTDMVYCDNAPFLENLFVADTANGNAAINGTNMNDNNAFTNSIAFNLYNNRYTSLSYDNFYPEKRLLMADPINHVLEAQPMFNYTATPTPLLDSAATAGMALDFISADTTFKMIAVSSRTTGILGIATSIRNPDGSVYSYLDTTLTSAVNATAPVGMVLVKNGNNLQYWVADNGQNKLLRISLYSYQITPTLPAGLIFNSISGVIEGTPTTVTAPQTYTLSIYSLLGSTSTTFTLGVTPANGLSNAVGTSTSAANQADGKSVTHTDPNNCTQLAVITDFVGGKSPGYTQVNQTVSTASTVAVGNKNFIRRVTSVKAQQTESLKGSLKLWFTYQDVQAFNVANPTNPINNDTTLANGHTTQIATLHMHDTINAAAQQWGKQAIFNTALASWLPTRQLWEVVIPISKLSDFYVGPPSAATGFSCSTTGSNTITANDYYVWNYDTLFTSGNYVDTLINHTGCDSIAKLNLTINITTGVSQMANGSGINVYPNPNNGVFNIHFSASAVEPSRVRVINVLGTEVYNKIHASSTSIDLKGVDNGVYFVIIEHKDKPIVWRIIKQD
jgi:alpha-tubulin suppressor-like RCC1 family protein